MKFRGVKVRQWLSAHKKRLVIGVPCGLLGMMVLAQMLYPSDRLLPWQQVDGQHVGMQLKHDAANMLDEKYKTSTLSLYFGSVQQQQYTPKLAELGLSVANGQRLEGLAYPWYMRLLPTSIFWMHRMVDTAEPSYTHDNAILASYLKKLLGDNCRITPRNATAKRAGDTLVVVKEEDGGKCEQANVMKVLRGVEPVLDKDATVRIAMQPITAALTSSQVKPVVETVNSQLMRPIQLVYDGKTELIDAVRVRQWLTFSSSSSGFEIGFDAVKADVYLQGKLGKAMERAAGVSKVATHDFVETSRVDGQTGRKLDTGKTLANLKEFLLAKTDTIPVGEAITPPQVQYTRSYSNTDTGLSALMKNYAESHTGTYGVSLVELDGKHRRAAFNDTQKFTTASTYKLYVAFSTLKRIESGEYKWSDQTAGGRDLAKCFDDMIVRSDNACAEALVARIGYGPITKDAQTIVSPSTTFLDRESYKTTAGDLSTFMASLATGQISLKPDSQARFVDALKRNIYRQGIPAGASGAVADKVGFLDGLLHDAAIVYGASGTYALSIMTDKSSWANIAELTREIEKLRNQ